MNSEIIKTQNSRLGIASFVLAIFLWAFFIVMIVLLTQSDLLNKIFAPIEGLKNDNLGLSGLLRGFFWIFVLFILIPFGGHFIGLILGIVGAVQKNKKRFFPIAGIILNGLYFVGLMLLSIISAFFRAAKNS